MTIDEPSKKLLSERGWLSAVPADFRDTVLERCRAKAFDAGQLVQDIGDDERGVYGLLSARVEILLGRGDDVHAVAHVAQNADWFGA